MWVFFFLDIFIWVEGGANKRLILITTLSGGKKRKKKRKGESKEENNLCYNYNCAFWNPGNSCLFFFFFPLIFLLLLAIPHDMWDLRSPTRDQTHAPCIGVLPLHHQGSPQKSLVFIMERHVWTLLLGRGAR